MKVNWKYISTYQNEIEQTQLTRIESVAPSAKILTKSTSLFFFCVSSPSSYVEDDVSRSFVRFHDGFVLVKTSPRQRSFLVISIVRRLHGIVYVCAPFRRVVFLGQSLVVTAKYIRRKISVWVRQFAVSISKPLKSLAQSVSNVV